jgi:hypothetical protein
MWSLANRLQRELRVFSAFYVCLKMAAKMSPAAFWIVVVAVAMVAIYCPSGKHLFLLVFVFDQFARDQFSFMCGSNCSGGSRVRDMRADVVGVPEHQTKLQRMVHA